MKAYLPTSDLIINYLPDFCWQTTEEVVNFLQQIIINLDPESIKVTLCLLARRGVLISRPVKSRWVKGWWVAREYRRAS
jgi:hypothetical protein